jgi:epoxyqueuosine reductase
VNRSATLATGIDLGALRARLNDWAKELGFQQLGVCQPELSKDQRRLDEWLAAGCHGEMSYMTQHGTKRSRPAELVPGTVRVISARMDYLAPGTRAPWSVINDSRLAYLSRYALGRDYHRVLRARLRRLAQRIEADIGPFGYRVMVDSAPVLEKPLARDAGLGWIGKHTNLISKRAGSWFFLGEIYTDLPLPADPPMRQSHCGTCRRCIDICPTGAIIAPYQLDARRCIAYLTIELRGSIPVPMRPMIGNRIFGCDDCQLVCPWNRFAARAALPDFAVRHGLDAASLVTLFSWSEQEFLRRSEGMAIRRIGYPGWLRNLAVALGNATPSPAIRAALASRQSHPAEIVREHVQWAFARQSDKI